MPKQIQAATQEVLAAEGLDVSDRRRVARACIEGGWVRFSEGNDLEAGQRLIERGIALAEGLPTGCRLPLAPPLEETLRRLPYRVPVRETRLRQRRRRSRLALAPSS